MCGICGVVVADGRVATERLVAMRESIAHRGPDGASGVLISSEAGAAEPFEETPRPIEDRRYDVGLAHRRLAIIDVAHGHQPMVTDDGRSWLVYNGELYNYRELRRELAAAGRSFRTECDTEVLLRAWEHWGDACTERLNGIFAFAIWDGTRHELFLARDHFGVKPLYYARTDRGFAFGSEAKAVIASGLVDPGLDVDALGLALTFRYLPSPATLFAGIAKLEPGSAMRVRRDGSFTTTVFERAQPRLEAADWRQALATAMDEAVRRQMVSDVPIGLSLSSGADSTTMLALMSRATSTPVETFTIGFAGATRGADEVPVAQERAREHGAMFHPRLVTQDEYLAFMDRYMWHMEEPIGNESAPAYHFVAETAREAGVKVLLTGQGPDELFAGYDRHIGIAYARLLRAATHPALRPLLDATTRGRGMGEKRLRFEASVGGARRLHDRPARRGAAAASPRGVRRHRLERAAAARRAVARAGASRNRARAHVVDRRAHASLRQPAAR
jgi:asparagine synthase (glutamine-hydrolysing)